MKKYRREKDSPYCIILILPAGFFDVKSCVTFHLAKMGFFGYNKSTRRSDSNVLNLVDPYEKQDRKASFSLLPNI